MAGVGRRLGAVSEFFNSYIVVGLVGLVPVLLAGGTLLAGRLVRPKGGKPERAIAYESGADAKADEHPTYIRYYLYALLFVVFDVEVVFILPWALQVESLGYFALIEMLTFIAILALGLAYAWRKKVLDWRS